MLNWSSVTFVSSWKRNGGFIHTASKGLKGFGRDG